MIVWERVFSGSNVEIRGRIHDNEGNAVSPIVSITNSGLCRNPCVTWLSEHGRYLVVWEQDDRVRAQLFDDTTGAPPGNAHWISTPANGARDQRPDVASSGSEYAAITWDRTGAGLNHPNQIMLAHGKWGWGGLNFEDTTVVQTVSPSSGYVRGPRLPHSLARYAMSSYPGTESYYPHLAWERFWSLPAPGDTDILHARFRVTDAQTWHPTIEADLAPANVLGASEWGVDEVTPSIARTSEIWLTGSSILIAWDDDGDIRATRNPHTIFADHFAVRATSAIQSMPAVGGGYCDFTVSYAEANPATPFSKNILTARVLPGGIVPVSDRPIDILNGPNQGGLRVASAPAGTGSTQDRTSTQLLVWWGETGIGAGARDVRARFFEPVAPNTFPYGAACSGPGQSLPQIGMANGNPIPGNDTFRFTISNGPPNSIAILMVSDLFTTTALPGAPGCNLYVGLPLISTTPAVVLGNGMGSLIMPIPPCVPHGTALAFQWTVFTPGWNPLGLVFSDDLDISWTH